MGWRGAGLVGLTLAWLAGCSDETTSQPEPEPPAGCAPAETKLADGSCISPGIAPEACGSGFEPDGNSGCAPVLPTAPCSPGLMAVPGDASCRPIMDCGAGTWGDIPVDATTQFVDASYTGGASDGSQTAPWTTITQAYEAVAPGGTVAVAAGSYAEDVFIFGKPASVIGVCPDLVEIRGAGLRPAAVIFGTGVAGSLVRGVAIRSVNHGITSQGSLDVVVDGVWIHDCAGRGVNVEDPLGPTRLTVRDSLIENNQQLGLFTMGSELIVESTHVRSTLPVVTDPSSGRGLNVQLTCTPQDGCDPSKPSFAQIVGSHVELNVQAGILVMGSNVVVDSTVVRDTQPHPSDDGGGVGIAVQTPCIPNMGCDPSAPSTATIERSAVLRNHESGVVVAASQATIRSTVIADTQATSAQDDGRGIQLQPSCVGGSCNTTSGAVASVDSVVVAGNVDAGILVVGSHLDLSKAIVRDQKGGATATLAGRGVTFQPCLAVLGCATAMQASGSVVDSLLERNLDIGLAMFTPDATVQRVVVRDTGPRPVDGLFGDGVAVVVALPDGEVTITNLWSDGSARAGLANFGSAVTLSDSKLSCSVVDLVSEPIESQSPTFDDLGGNVCGCPATDACKASSSGVTPPEPLEPAL